MNQYFKSIIDQDNATVVICNLDHEIIYMNPAAIANYAKRGGDKLLGQNLLACHNPHSQEIIKKVVEWFKDSKGNNKVHTFFNEKHNRDVYMVALRDDNGELIGYYEKHECRTRDTSPFYDMKYTPNELLQYVKDEELEFDFLNAVANHVQAYTIAELTDSQFQQEAGQWRYKSKTYAIDVPITDDEILTAVINGLYISAFLSRYEDEYQVHFLVHKYPTSMKPRFEEEITRDVIDYMIIKTIVQLKLDNHEKIKSYINF